MISVESSASRQTLASRERKSPPLIVSRTAGGRVAVVRVVLGRVDAALGGDRVRAPRAVLVAEALDPVAQLGQRCRRGGSPGQAPKVNCARW
jgi:hypothetical protein